MPKPNRFMPSLLAIGLLFSMTLMYTNCGTGFDVASEDFASTSPLAMAWSKFSADAASTASSTSTHFSQWVYPNYALLPMTEAGSHPFSMNARRLTDRSGDFEAPVAFFKSNAINVYNSNIVHISSDLQYPYRMYFFGWAKEACNTHLPYHPEHDPANRRNEDWCDSIFMARAPTRSGPWQVLEETSGAAPSFKANLQNAERWKPVIYSNQRHRMWDYHHSGDPSVIHINGLYFMAYSVTGHDIDGISEHRAGQDTDGAFYSIGGAYSLDGIQWVKLAQPLLVSARDPGANELAAGVDAFDMMYHRPSLMYDEGKFKMWFDFRGPGAGNPFAMGYAELNGAPSIDVFSTGRWTIKQGRENPAIQNWPNPVVVKTRLGYFSYADPIAVVGNETSWSQRKISEAFSSDGINWTLNGYLPHKAGCVAQVPEALYANGELVVSYFCVEGANRDTMYQVKRKTLNVQDPGARICNPGAVQSCPIPNGTGAKTCNAAGTSYGSCQVASCNAGFQSLSGSCVSAACRAPSATREYVTTSIRYFSEALRLPQAAAVSIARSCLDQIQAGINLLNQSDWECSRADLVANQVKACVQKVEAARTGAPTPTPSPTPGPIKPTPTPAACVAPASSQQYLTTAVTYLQTASTIPKVATNARACLTNLQKSLPVLQSQRWPCAETASAVEYVSTCIEKVIKPAL